MIDPNNGGKAIIEDDYIVIRVKISDLPIIVEGSWASGELPLKFIVSEPEEFAKDLVSELNRENEIGTTNIHRMFDRTIQEAIDQGALGIELDKKYYESEKGHWLIDENNIMPFR